MLFDIAFINCSYTFSFKLRLPIREKLRNEILLRNIFRRSVYRNAKVQAKTSFAVVLSRKQHLKVVTKCM